MGKSKGQGDCFVPRNDGGWRKIAVEVCRVILGVTFVFSGTVKDIDPVGGALKLEDYFGAFGLSWLNSVALFGSINLSTIEFVLGVCILAGVYRRIIALSFLLFMSFMTLLTLYLAIFNPVHDCGCFGDALIITNWQTFFKNALLLLPASIAVFLWHRKITPLYTHHTYWFVVVFAYLFSLGFSYWNYYNLPITDFRPYKVGSSIPANMSYPADAAMDEYIYIYVSKDGAERRYKLDELGDLDTTLTFKDSELLKKGYTPPIVSFELYDSQGNNIADRILEEGRTVFLLVAPYLKKASDSHIDDINNACDYAKEQGIDFYCLTASAAEDIRDWVNNTGAEYPFLTADDVTLKTMIRSNPGLMLLRSGEVKAKWHYLNIPSEEALKAETERLLNSADSVSDEKNRLWILVVLSFIVPLLLVWIYDFKIFRKK